jgi:hypothetical protein
MAASRVRLTHVIACALFAASCGFEGYDDLASARACDPDATTFTVEIDNPFFPLPEGQQVVLEGEADLQGAGHEDPRTVGVDAGAPATGMGCNVARAIVDVDVLTEIADGPIPSLGEEVA